MSLDAITTIFHPSDFSKASHVAFEHALKLALLLKADLRIMHVTEESVVDWTEFPGVRETLTRWKLLPDGSPRAAVLQLGIDVQKILAQNTNPLPACLLELERNPAELIVLSTHQHKGRMSWLQQPVAEPLSRASGAMTLFVPHGSGGFVDSDDGSLRLRSILVPVAKNPSPSAALNAISRLLAKVHSGPGVVTTLHVGSGDAQLETKSQDSGWTWRQRNHDGPVVETILSTAREVNADLIAMTTQGRNGFLDLLRGTKTERVLREAKCPVLAIAVQQ